MSKFRFSLLSLLLATAAAAVGCAALANPTDVWSLIVTNSCFAVLSVAVLAAIYGYAGCRAFWVGFAVIGWGYLAVGWRNEDDGQTFVTSRLLNWLAEQTLAESSEALLSIPPSGTPPVPIAFTAPTVVNPASGIAPPVTVGFDFNVPATASPVQQAGSYIAVPTAPIVGPAVDPQALSRLMSIGHSLWALVFGFAGGVVARAFYFRRERLAARAATGS